MKLNVWQRLWVLASGMWIAGWLLYLWTRASPLMPWEKSEVFLEMLVVPPVVYGFGLLARWVLRGFTE